MSIFLYIIGLFRSTVLRVMSPTRFLCATMIGVSLGGFDPPPLDLLVCDHYTTNGWFRSTSSNPPVCDHTLQRRVLIYAPIHLLQDFSIAHICHSLHCVHLPIFFQTFGKYIVFQTLINICPLRLLQDFSIAYIRHSLRCVHFRFLRIFVICPNHRI